MWTLNCHKEMGRTPWWEMIPMWETPSAGAQTNAWGRVGIPGLSRVGTPGGPMLRIWDTGIPNSWVSRESFEISRSAQSSSSSSSTPCPLSPCPWHHPYRGQGGEDSIQPNPAHFHPHSGGPYARSSRHEAEDKLRGCFL